MPINPNPRACVYLLCALYLLVALACAAQASAAPANNEQTLRLVRADPSGLVQWRLYPNGTREQTPLPADAKAPLGSLWKLWVYAYLAAGAMERDQGSVEEPYTCQGNNPEEVYCCGSKGETLQRDQALAKSCGLYFDPARLKLDAAQWRRFWQGHKGPAGILELANLRPDYNLPIRDLLTGLAELPAAQQARQALLAVMLAGDPPYVEQLGSRLRVKTWSWRDERGANIAGFAGWLADGSVLWAQGSGASAQVLKQFAPALNQFLPNPAPAAEVGCVLVNLFANYPIAQVLNSQGKPQVAGPITSASEVVFAKGNRLQITPGNAKLELYRDGGTLKLRAQMGLEDYVARVLEREAAAEPAEAAKALAITARTYLWQNAQPINWPGAQGQCLAIDDSSKTQRVLPNPATAKAQQIAHWTADLISQGKPVRYHLDQAGENRLVWQDAVRMAQQGASFSAILSSAFGENDLASWHHKSLFCKPLPQAQNWLAQQLPKWRAQLINQPGFTPPPLPSICQLQSGNPYNDAQRNRIFARGFYSLQQRLDITHEYLHLAFADYPTGQDETYIEQLARRLLLGQEI